MDYARKVLVVDDNESIHQDIESILSLRFDSSDEEIATIERVLFDGEKTTESTHTSNIEYIIDHAYQGDEAVKMADEAVNNSTPYTLIFMDVRMPPGIDGVQAIKQIWKKHPHTEIVICTAYADYSWDQILENLGQSDKLLFMKKPFDPTALNQMALTLTTKWQLQQEALNYTKKLEREVEEQTRDLRNLLDEYKRMKDEAEKAAEAKSVFLANMSHEIRTPMNGVLAMNELLNETDLTEEQEEYCDLAQQSSHALLRIINDILDFSKIEAGKMSIEEIPFNLKDLVRVVSKMATASARHKEIDVDYYIDDRIPEVLKGDPIRIQQILLNYGTNAVKFTKEGNIEFKVEMVNEKEMILLFSVSDTGSGIEEKNLTALFTPFSQADSSTTRKYGGTGLGLAICKQLAELMNGEVGAESEAGTGSTFWFKVGLGKAVSEEVTNGTEEKETSFSAAQSGKDNANYTARILIAEDNRVNQIVLERMLSKENFELRFVFNGREAIQAVKNNHFDLILMDLQMPEMDGLKAATAIRKFENGSRPDQLPIIALTGSTLDNDKTPFLDAGMNDYLTKPVAKKMLVETLHKWLADEVSSDTN